MAFQIIPFTTNGSSILPPRNFMLIGQYLESPSKKYKLVLEADMNLVLYDDGIKIWVADSSVPYTYGDDRPNTDLPNCFYMQGSGFLVDHINRRTWIAVTSWIPVDEQEGRPDRNYLQLQDDGNIVIVDRVPVWARFGFTPTAEPQPQKIYDTGLESWSPKDFNIWTF